MAGLTEELHDEAAERYAQAAFALALEAGEQEQVDADLQRFAAAFRESAELREAARSPLIDAQDKSRALTAVAAALGLGRLAHNLVGVTALNGRAKELPQIAKAFHAALTQHKGLRQVEIISAAPLEAEQRAALLAAVKTALGADLEAVDRVDARLIGGFIVRAGSRQFDASVRSKLDGLKLALLKV